jgi:hypothetical protein
LFGLAFLNLKLKFSVSTSFVARALDNDEYVLIASLDLSAGFDVVIVKLLIKRFQIFGLPDNLIKLINEWLLNMFCYVDINGCTSTLFELPLVTVWGPFLGPILYAWFISPYWNKEVCLSFPNDLLIIQITPAADKHHREITGSTDKMAKRLVS